MYRAKALMMLTAFCTMLVFSGAVAQAQYTPNYTTSIGTTSINSYYSPLATMNRADRERLYRRRSSDGNSGSGGNSGSNRHGSTVTGTRSSGGDVSPTASTTFRPFSSQPLMPHKMALDQAHGSPERLQHFEKMFTDSLVDYKAAVRAKGAPLNDVARAMSFFIYNTYYVSTGGHAPTDSQIEPMRDFVRQVLLHDQKFQRMSAREKQEMYESLAIWASVTMGGYQIGKEDKRPELQAEMQRIARYLLEQTLGVPVEQIRFTENGLEY